MGVKAVPIPLELWQRLAALDARCDFEIKRHDANEASHRHTSLVNYDRQWEVRIWPKREREKAVRVYFGSLEPTLRKAVMMTEGNGWQRELPLPAPSTRRGMSETRDSRPQPPA
jgi:hypothetical protein